MALFSMCAGLTLRKCMAYTLSIANRWNWLTTTEGDGEMSENVASRLIEGLTEKEKAVLKEAVNASVAGNQHELLHSMDSIIQILVGDEVNFSELLNTVNNS